MSFNREHFLTPALIFLVAVLTLAFRPPVKAAHVQHGNSVPHATARHIGLAGSSFNWSQ